MSIEAHEFDTTINDLQLSPDRTYFITAGKDKTARVNRPRIFLSIFTNCVEAHLLARPKYHEDICC